ncbi:MAG: penicillin-binding protein 2, partial [Nitrosomonadales bacterium]|nr:penicillin-binding protein 2 [Nitrosomonadales bacterium]
MQRNQLRFVIAKRQSIVVGLFFVLLFLIIIKFFLVQVVQHNYFEKKSVNNSIKLIPIAPSRGLIVDRNNKVLAANKLIYNIELDPNKKHDFDNIRTHLRSIISISDADVEQ